MLRRKDGAFRSRTATRTVRSISARRSLAADRCDRRCNATELRGSFISARHIPQSASLTANGQAGYAPVYKSRRVPAVNDYPQMLNLPRRPPSLVAPVQRRLYSVTSNKYTSVDGTLNCLTVYWRRSPSLDGNNHLLYPANVLLWSHFVSLIGFHARDPIAFLHTIAAMNAVCAAGSVALVNLIVWRFTRAWKLSLFTAVGYGLSWALLVHATNSAQPVVGLFISLLATLLVTEGLAREHHALLFVGGVLLALALANYESMFLLAPLFIWPARSGRLYPRLAKVACRHMPVEMLCAL